MNYTLALTELGVSFHFPPAWGSEKLKYLQPSGLFYGETRRSDLPKVTLGPCGIWVSASGAGSSGPALQLLSSLPPPSPQHRGGWTRPPRTPSVQASFPPGPGGNLPPCPNDALLDLRAHHSLPG